MDNNGNKETNVTLDNQSNQNSSTDNPKDTSEYLKPWMKNLGKAFSQNKEIAEYESLSDCVTDLLKRPKTKEVPDSYDGISEDLSSIFKKSGLTKEEAVAIDGYYQKLIPKTPDLKEVFGDNFDKIMASYDKGKNVLKDIAIEAEKTGDDKNPLFVKLMAIIGDNSANSTFIPPNNKSEEKSGFEELIDRAYGVK